MYLKHSLSSSLHRRSLFSGEAGIHAHSLIQTDRRVLQTVGWYGFTAHPLRFISQGWVKKGLTKMNSVDA